MIEPGLIRTQLDRVLASPTFADAARASRFLRFVVDRALEGEASAIKESVIAVEAFGRAPSFDPKIDPIVRAEAGRLRTRLSSYYENEGKRDAILIALPKGGYVPEFSHREPPPPLPKRLHPALLLTGGALLGIALAWLGPSILKRSAPKTELQRLSVLPPPGSVIKSSVISPDGRYLAFTANLDGHVVLWIRGLDSLSPKALPGTEGAAYPFWSPDSRSIGFFSPFKLKRIDLNGGPPETICNGGIARGATWSPNGVIVFAPGPGDVLYQVPSKGGVPTPVTSLNRSRSELSHTFPHFLPDGRHFLYLVTSSGGSGPAVYAGSLDSMESKFLLHAGSGAVYRPAARGQSASLLLEYEGALMSQSFDTEHLRMRGSRSLVDPVVLHDSGRADVSVSSNGVLAYQGRSSKDRQLAWFDRNGRLIEKVGLRNKYFGWNLARDGGHLVTSDEDPLTLMATMWTMDLDRRSLSRFLSLPEWAFFPIWSPDGTEILFGRGSKGGMSLERRPVNGGTPVTVLASPGTKFLSDWSVDGKFVTYFGRAPGFGTLAIWIVPVSGSDPQPKPRLFSSSSFLETSAYFSPVIGPQGPRWIAYASDETGRSEIYIRNFPAGDRKWRVSTDGGWLPHWRADGRELFYLALDGSMMAADIILDTKDRDGFKVGLPNALFPTSIGAPPGYPEPPVNTYAVSRDGRRFLINGAADDEATKAITVVLGSRTDQP